MSYVNCIHQELSATVSFSEVEFWLCAIENNLHYCLSLFLGSVLQNSLPNWLFSEISLLYPDAYISLSNTPS